MFRHKFALILGCASLLMAGNARAGDYVLTLKDHKFEPTQLSVPAGQKVKLIVKNQDGSPAEFESYDLNREKIIKGGAEATVYIGPLEPGTYKVFDDFHNTTTATIKAQ